VTTYLDAGGAVKEWVNTVSGLTGASNPIPLGASLKQREGAANAAYGYIVELPATTWGGAEHQSLSARIELQIYGPTKEAAATAAVAYCEALMTLVHGQRAILPESGATLVGADNVEGPQWFPDNEEPRYIVDADFLFL
jgi:hypothetical protein